MAHLARLMFISAHLLIYPKPEGDSPTSQPDVFCRRPLETGKIFASFNARVVEHVSALARNYENNI